MLRIDTIEEIGSTVSDVHSKICEMQIVIDNRVIGREGYLYLVTGVYASNARDLLLFCACDCENAGKICNR